MDGFAAFVCAPPHGRALCWCAPPPPRWGVLCGCMAPPMVGRAVPAPGPPHGRAFCVVVWPPSWWGLLCRCVAPLMVGHALLLPARRGGCAWCGGAWLGLSSCVPPGGRRRWVRVGGAFGGILAGAMRGLFCLFVVVFAALPSACLGGCGQRLGCGCGSVIRLAGLGSVLARSLPHGGACFVGAYPPPMLGRAVLVCGPPMVRRAVLVRGPPQGGACCADAYLPRWWCVVWWCLAWVVVVCWVAVVVVLFALPGLVLCWCVAPPLSGRGVFVRGPPHGGACCVGVWPPRGGACCVGLWPPSWCGVLCWCVAPIIVGCAVLVPVRRGGGVWCGGFGLGCRRPLGCGCGCVVCLAGVSAVLVRAPPPPIGACWACAWPPPWWGVPCWCVGPLMVGRAVLVCSGFGSWCVSRLDARLVLLVHCCLRCRSASIVGCWLS